MDVTSLAWQTDLALLRLGGSTVDDEVDHLVVRTPHNPSFWWGNFLLLARPPADEAEARRWLARHESEFAAEHVAIGVDSGSGEDDPLATLRAVGLDADVSTVMTATAVHPPARPHDAAAYRPLVSDDEWAQQVELSCSVHDGVVDDAHRLFERRRVETTRTLVDAGHGAWFGAFHGERLVSSMGLFRAGATAAGPLARFQNVATALDVRGQGLAGTLVHHVSRWGFGELGARTLVMVADPDYLAIRVYRSVGFADTETQLAVARRPGRDES